MLIVAKNIGFCFGVQKAINSALNTYFKEKNRNIYTIGSLIHNDIVNKQLSEKRIICIDETDIESVINDNPVLIIRAHGIKKELLEKLHKYKRDGLITLIDSTCPFVTSIHNFLQKNTNDNTLTIYFGNPNHPETIGSISFIKGEYIIVDSFDSFIRIKNTLIENNKQTILFSQTTSDYQDFKIICNELKNIKSNPIIFDSVCKTTIERQIEADEISKIVDITFVLGDKKSSNTLKLYNIAKNNCPNSFLIEKKEDINFNDLNLNAKIGLLTGASTPEIVIKDVIDALK